MNEDDFNICYDAALHFLEYRQRSAAEITNFLLYKRKCKVETARLVLEKLKQIGLVNDKIFAESWMIDRVTHKQKSSAIIRHELLIKGVDSEIINQVTANIDDAENAMKAGKKKARLLRNLEYPEFSRRLASYLGRRGFGTDVVKDAIPRLWNDVKQQDSKNINNF